MIQTMRCFVAVDLAAAVVDGLRGVQGEISQKLAGDPQIKWVSPAAMHMTLKFLGDKVDVGVTPAVKDALVRASQTVPSFSLHVRGVGASPTPDAARVVWAELQASADLEDLWQAVEGGLEEIGFRPHNRLLSPHVTLGRVRDHLAKPDLSAALHPLADRDFGTTPVNSVVLYRSTLTHNGPRYEALARAQLDRPNPSHPPEN